MGNIFSTVKIEYGGKTGSIYNFAFTKDRNIVPMPKWDYK